MSILSVSGVALWLLYLSFTCILDRVGGLLCCHGRCTREKVGQWVWLATINSKVFLTVIA